MIYIAIDIETTGLSAVDHDVIEFGAVIDDQVTPFDQLPRFHTYLIRDYDEYRGTAFCFAMHHKIFDRISKREEGWSYTPSDCLGMEFYNWLLDQDLDLEKKITFAGKNIEAFDLPFLKHCGFGKGFKKSHRSIDVGNLFLDLSKEEVPSLQECLELCGYNKKVNHTALEDAEDVVRCIRKKFDIGL